MSNFADWIPPSWLEPAFEDGFVYFLDWLPADVVAKKKAYMDYLKLREEQQAARSEAAKKAAKKAREAVDEEEEPIERKKKPPREDRDIVVPPEKNKKNLERFTHLPVGWI